MTEKPLCAGWLCKIGFNSGKWQSRYFVLTPTSLQYFADVGGKLKGTIFVSAILSMEAVNPGAVIAQEACTTKPKRPVGPNALKITAKIDGIYRSFYLEATSPQDQKVWLKTLTLLKEGKIKAGAAGPAKKKGPRPTLIPRSEQASRLDITKQPWFQRKFSEKLAGKILNNAPTGAFIITESAAKKGSFTVSLIANGKVVKLLLQHRKVEGRNYWCLGLMYFEHILDFVMHYSRKPINLKAIDTKVLLSLPACREALKKYKAAKAKAQQAKEQAAVEESSAAPEESSAQAEAAKPDAELSPELQKLSAEVADLKRRQEMISRTLTGKQAKVDTAAEAVNATKVSVEITTSSAERAMEQIAARLDDQEEQLAELSALSEAGGPAAPPAAEVESIKGMIEDARAQADETKTLFTDNMKNVADAIARVESLITASKAGLAPAGAMLQPLGYMLDQAAQTLRNGGHPGDIRANTAVMFSQSEQAVNAADDSLKQVQACIDTAEGFLKIDYAMSETLAEIDEALNEHLSRTETEETGGDQAGDDDGDDEDEDVGEMAAEFTAEPELPDDNDDEFDEEELEAEFASIEDGDDDDDDDDDDVIDIMASVASVQDPTSVPAGTIADPSLKEAMSSLSKGGEYDASADQEANKREADEREAALEQRREEDRATARSWLQGVLQRELPEDMHEALKDGTALCETINALSEGSVPNISRSKMAFQQMENIGFYLAAVEAYGLRQEYTFQTVDLYEAQNMPGVINSLIHLKNLAKEKGFQPEPFAADPEVSAEPEVEAEAAGNAEAEAGQQEEENTPAEETPTEVEAAEEAETEGAASDGEGTDGDSTEAQMAEAIGEDGTAAQEIAGVNDDVAADIAEAVETTMAPEDGVTEEDKGNDKDAKVADDKPESETAEKATPADASSANTAGKEAAGRSLSMTGKALPMPRRKK